MKNLLANHQLRKLCSLAGVLALGWTLTAKADGTNSASASENDTEYRNWITLGGGGSFVDGDAGAFHQRTQQPRWGYGGIEDFHWEHDIGKKGLFELNGHGMYDSHNFGVDLKYADPDKGYVKAGFEQFRTWYDASAGYYPGGTNHWKELNDSSLGLDRGHAWFEAGLRKEHFPELTFRYDHEFRQGQKGSTIWADASVVGTSPVYPTPTATSPTTRGFAPTFWDINERRDAFALDAKQGFGKTELAAGVRYERLVNNDAYEAHRRPGEIAGANAQQRADRYLTERQSLVEDLFNAHASALTRFSEKTRLSVGGSYTLFDTDIGGSRIFGNRYDPIIGNYLRSQQRDSGFFNLSGGSRTHEYAGNVNMMFTPFKNFVLVPSIRFGAEDMDGNALFLPTTVNSAGGNLVTNAITKNVTARESLEVTEALEARYTGFTNWSLYARAELSQTDGKDLYQIFTNSITQLNETEHWQRDWQKYTFGANWYPRKGLNFGGQYYYKSSDYDYALRSQVHDVNFRAAWRPVSALSFVARYDYQLATFHGESDAEVGEVTAHIISGTINWVPINRLYLQLGANYSFENNMDTPAATSAGITNVVPNLDSAYFTGNATIGYAIDEKTDLTVTYTYYKADDYVNNARWSVPFGAAEEQHTIATTLARQLTKRVRGTLQYTYARNRDEASGGYNDFDAHMIYASMQYKF